MMRLIQWGQIGLSPHKKVFGQHAESLRIEAARVIYDATDLLS